MLKKTLVFTVLIILYVHKKCGFIKQNIDVMCNLFTFPCTLTSNAPVVMGMNPKTMKTTTLLIK